MPQLQLNQGPQDALLFDNTKSYFTNVGYQRTSNFQMELRDVDPQNAANFGQSVSFIIPKAADLLGPVDLMIDFNTAVKPDATLSAYNSTNLPPGQGVFWGWVDNVGYAMIEKITFAVGSHDVEVLTGESLNIINELMRSGSSRYGFQQTLKTGRPLFKQELDGGGSGTVTPQSRANYDPNPDYTSYDRIITYAHRHHPQVHAVGPDFHHSTWWDSLERPGTLYPHETTHITTSGDLEVGAKEGKHLCIPLGLFFTAHPSKYFPIAAIAGCNDIRVTIKFRQLNEVIMQKGTFRQESGYGPSQGSLIMDPVRLRTAITGTDNSWAGDNITLTMSAPAATGGVAATFRVVSNQDDTTAEIIDIIMTNPGRGYTTSDTLVLTYAVGGTDVAAGLTPAAFRVATTTFGTTPGATGLVFTINPGAGRIRNVAPTNNSLVPTVSQSSWFKECKLRCHYIHVTGPEATALMNREHVRLMKLMDDTNHQTKQFTISCSPTGEKQTLSIDLNFLHPVQEIIMTIRKVSEMGSSISNSDAPGPDSGKSLVQSGSVKNYFAYHGSGRDPNFENWTNSVDCDDPRAVVGKPTYLKTTNFQLKLNGQSRHLDGQGISRDYLMNRLMPMIHSAAREDFLMVAQHSSLEEFLTLSELMDRKEIYVYPFALNPEGANPSGSVNFSKVSHAKLDITVEGWADLPTLTGTATDDYIVDVYGVYYNWLAIKDGRALTSFA
jgi:hypothetical protein